MKKLIVFLLILSGVMLSAENLLKNPEFSGILNRSSNIKGWIARKEFCRISDGVIRINIPAGEKLQILSDVVVIDQKEPGTIEFGLEYKGSCATKSWEHCIVLSDLTYQDGTREKWASVMIQLPLKADDWKTMKKTLNLPKPVKSFRFMILLKDETKAEVRKPYVYELKKKEKTEQSLTLVLPKVPLASEQFAAEELANHIEKITGKRPVVVKEGAVLNTTSSIFIGRTSKALKNGFDFSRFSEEQWQITSVDGGLLIGGGECRGTLYGVYHYLEKFCGVRWFTASESLIPKMKNLPVNDLHLSGRPAFRYRAVWSEGHDFDSNFLSRNRHNSDFNGYKYSIYDGIPFIGPSVHTHCLWVKPAKYFKSNPEFFALGKDGKRDPKALCLMNKGVRKAMIHEVREALRKRYAEADKNPLPSIQLVNISHMDTRVRCFCRTCQSFAEKHEAESAYDIDFINEVAGALKKEFPNVFFVTLAYTYTEKPPVGMTVADNVFVQMCDTTSSVTVPVTAPENHFFANSLRGWSKITKNLFVWDYWVTYNFNNGAVARDLPCATVENVQKDLQFFREQNVQCFFSEQEFACGTSDAYDYKQYIFLKLMEDPAADIEKLSVEFAEKFYGPAGTLFLEYRRKLAEIQKKWRPYIDWNPSFGRYTYLTYDFLVEMQSLFDRGEKLLAGDAVRLARWRSARVSLDRAICFRISYLIEEFLRTGQPVEKFPFDLQKCANRIKETLQEIGKKRYDVRNIRLPKKNSAIVAANLKRTIDKNLGLMRPRLIMTKPVIPAAHQLPGELAGTSRKSLHIFPISSAYLHNETQPGAFKFAEEKDSIFGCVAYLDFEPAKWKFDVKGSALHVFTYQTDTKKTMTEIKLPFSKLDKSNWTWVHYGKIKASANTYLAISGTWLCQFDLSNLAGPERKMREYDLWIRVRCRNIAPGKDRLEFDTLILKNREEK